jgi:hypothetical protein
VSEYNRGDDTRGDEIEQSFLSPEERADVKRMLKFPEEYPRELGAWVTDYVGTNAFLQKSQVQGLPLLFTQVADAVTTLDATVQALEDSQIVVTYAEVLTEQTLTTGSSYADLGTVGPTLSGLVNGQYLILFGSFIRQSGTGDHYVSISINGAGASDTDSSLFIGGGGASVTRAVVKTLSNGSNEIKMKYKQTFYTADASFGFRWLYALKIGA